MPRRKKRVIIPELLTERFASKESEVKTIESKKQVKKKKLDDKLLKFKFLCGGSNDS